MIRQKDFPAYERPKINNIDGLLDEYWKSQDNRPFME